MRDPDDFDLIDLANAVMYTLAICLFVTIFAETVGFAVLGEGLNDYRVPGLVFVWVVLAVPLYFVAGKPLARARRRVLEGPSLADIAGGPDAELGRLQATVVAFLSARADANHAAAGGHSELATAEAKERAALATLKTAVGWTDDG